MVCSSCNKETQSNIINKEISVSSLGNISQNRLIELYRDGYSINSNTNFLTMSSSPKIQSMDIGSSVAGLIELGLIVVGAYYVYKYCKKNQ